MKVKIRKKGPGYVSSDSFVEVAGDDASRPRSGSSRYCGFGTRERRARARRG
mgnify:CR=1 FL=1